MNEISNFILYTTPNGDVQLDILLQDENLWLTQKSLAELFGVERSVITKHLRNIYGGGELIRCQLVQNLHRFNKREIELSGVNLNIILNENQRAN